MVSAKSCGNTLAVHTHPTLAQAHLNDVLKQYLGGSKDPRCPSGTLHSGRDQCHSFELSVVLIFLLIGVDIKIVVLINM